MEGQRADRPHWGDWFPVREQILNHPDIGADTPLLVDIGAGRGHDLIGFRKRFPNAPGKLVLEDLSAVIEEVQGAQDLTAADIDTVSYDFFNQVQPVQGECPLSQFMSVATHPRNHRGAGILFQERASRLVR